MQNPPRDERSQLAKSVDFALTVLITWLLTIIIAAHLLPLELIAAKVAVITIMLVELMLIFKVKMLGRKSLDMHRDVWFSARKCRQNIHNIKDRSEFVILVQQLLEGLGSFETLKELNPGLDSTINFSGYLRNQKIGIMCLNFSGEDQKVTTDQIKRFLKEVKQNHFTKGMVVTSGSFTEDARRFVRRMNGRVKIHLIDGYGMLRWVKRTQHPIFTMERWEEERDTEMTGKEMALAVKENVLASKKRSLLFTVLGLVFLTIAAAQTGFFSIIYFIFGVINLFIGLTGFILRFLHKNELLFD